MTQTLTTNDFEIQLDEAWDAYSAQIADNLRLEIRHIGVLVKGASFATIRDRTQRANMPEAVTIGDGLRCYARLAVFTGRGITTQEHWDTVEWYNEGDIREMLKVHGLTEHTTSIVNAARECYKIWLARHFADGLNTLHKAFADATTLGNRSELLRHVYAINRGLKEFQTQVEAMKLNISDASDFEKFNKKWSWIGEAASYLDDVPLEQNDMNAIKDIVKRWHKLVKA